ncbi:MAG: hypothetical protein RL756_1845 [Pseudomonadota bacterium]
MNRSTTRLVHTVLALAAGAAGSAHGASCDDYPYTDGINIEDVAGGTKILATSSVSVTFDDVDSVQDARDEATMEAKSLISKFMSEDIMSDEMVNRVVAESKVATAEGKTATREELVIRVKTLRNSSQALLRGVVMLGDCYTPERELRVSVGIKPDTIRSAERLSGSMSESINRESVPTQSRDEADETLQDVDGYSNTRALKNF